MGWRAAVLACLLVATFGLPVAGQEAADLTLGQVRSPVLIIDSERVFAASLFGLRVAAQVQAETDALVTENRRIEAALTEEERSLTTRRPGMDVVAFRTEAEAFDARVQEIRVAQDAKQAALQDGIGLGREQFLQVATPILGLLMQDAGAAVILDRRSVFLAVGAIDVTDQAIARIDAAIGDGAAPPEPAPELAPELAPDPAPDPARDLAPDPAPAPGP